MRLKQDFFITCEQVIRDSEKGTISLINIIDNVIFDQLPGAINKLSFAIKFELEDVSSSKEQLNFSLSLTDPNGAKIGQEDDDKKKTIPMPLESGDKVKTYGMALEINSINAKEPGKYTVELVEEEEDLSMETAFNVIEKGK